MSAGLLERYISQRIESSPGQSVHFEWHGGEPTILGLDYFRQIVLLQKKYAKPGKKITNGIQTNGTYIDEGWAVFLKEEGFSVGLSLDGPAEFHDKYRKTAGGRPTHAAVEDAFKLLKRHGVFCNILCVLHKGNSAEPDMVYDYFRDIKANYIQFLPLALNPSPGRIAAAPPGIIGEFLCRIFDRWIKSDVGRIVIQTFDEALRPIYGVDHALCIHRQACGDAAVLEHDGSFYACDHFVDPGHLIGNLKTKSLTELANDPRMASFGNSKRDTLPVACLECSVLPSCNGGCPKDRAEGGINRLCPAYRMFFTHSLPELARLARHMKAGLPLREFKPY